MCEACNNARSTHGVSVQTIGFCVDYRDLISGVGPLVVDVTQKDPSTGAIEPIILIDGAQANDLHLAPVADAARETEARQKELLADSPPAFSSNIKSIISMNMQGVQYIVTVATKSEAPNAELLAGYFGGVNSLTSIERSVLNYCRPVLGSAL